MQRCRWAYPEMGAWGVLRLPRAVPEFRWFPAARTAASTRRRRWLSRTCPHARRTVRRATAVSATRPPNWRVKISTCAAQQGESGGRYTPKVRAEKSRLDAGQRRSD